MARGSAAWVIAIVSVFLGILGALILTVTDPIARTLFASSLYQGNTQYSKNLFTWIPEAWNYWPAFILLGIMIMVWIATRRPG